MALSRWIVCVLVATFLWSDTALSQSSELLDAANRMNELYTEGRYREAIPFAEDALSLSEHELGPDHITTGVLLSHFGILRQLKGDYGGAELLFKRALTISENLYGRDHPDVARGLNNLVDGV